MIDMGETERTIIMVTLIFPWTLYKILYCGWKVCVGTFCIELPLTIYIYIRPYFAMPHMPFWLSLKTVQMILCPRADTVILLLNFELYGWPMLVSLIWRFFWWTGRCFIKELKEQINVNEEDIDELDFDYLDIDDEDDNSVIESMHRVKLVKKKKELVLALKKKDDYFCKLKSIHLNWKKESEKENSEVDSQLKIAVEEMSSFIEERKTVQDEIEKLVTRNKILASKIIESEKRKNNLEKKKQKVESRNEEKGKDFLIEQDKLLNVINNLKDELKLIERCLSEDFPVKKELEKKTREQKMEDLAKEIEAKERDLECPVCFDVCNIPISCVQTPTIFARNVNQS